MGRDSLPVAVDVPFRPWAPARPGRCFVDVERLVRLEGGALVTGWIVCEQTLYVQLLHHAVWRCPTTGELSSITPQIIYGIGSWRTYAGPIRFLPDPAAAMPGSGPGRRALPSRFVAGDPRHDCACEALSRAEQAWFENRADDAAAWAREARRLFALGGPHPASGAARWDRVRTLDLFRVGASPAATAGKGLP
jgi:hypothetical protein